jgi:Fe-S oxidoreductase
MKQHQPLKVVNQLMNSEINGKISNNDRCCGESGTLAVTRPDISTQVRFRKEEEMRKGAQALRDSAGQESVVKILTSCPSCLQGLNRYREDVAVEADYIVATQLCRGSKPRRNRARPRLSGQNPPLLGKHH